MGLGNRTARAHETRGLARHALFAEEYHDFDAGDRVRTRDGIGRVTAVEDGPFPQTERYRIELESGLGGGLYDTREILGKIEDTTASVEQTAASDYPELGRILQDRPDIARGY